MIQLGWTIILTMGNTEESYPAGEWRVIFSDAMPGSLNMAVDAAILSAVGRNEVPPTLRLYRWDPPCISLGYSQPYSDLDQVLLQTWGWDVVRRPTGGRAILHTDELTYAVIGPKTDPRLDGGLLQTYRRISSALSSSLKILGLPVEIHSGKNPDANSQPVCFENPSDFEITVEGKKIIGSAQARKKEGILQHGTLPLVGDLSRITQVLHYSTTDQRELAAALLLQKATTVESVLRREVPWEESAQAFKIGFQNALNVVLIESNLVPSEMETSQQLEQTRFGNPNWTKQI
ncbi:MAG: lipoate--protein ligase family protein [Anaerolineales bacterium]